eukprot:jgi/Ulvmu1/9845/UM056_0087.1
MIMKGLIARWTLLCVLWVLSAGGAMAAPQDPVVDSYHVDSSAATASNSAASNVVSDAPLLACDGRVTCPACCEDPEHAAYGNCQMPNSGDWVLCAANGNVARAAVAAQEPADLQTEYCPMECPSCCVDFNDMQETGRCLDSSGSRRRCYVRNWSLICPECL